MRTFPPRRAVPVLLALAIISSALAAAEVAQPPSPATIVPVTAAAAAAPPATPPGARLVTSIRSKLSAAVLRSAESLAETWGDTQGDEGSYLLALSWVARGAHLLGEFDRAGEYVAGAEYQLFDDL